MQVFEIVAIVAIVLAVAAGIGLALVYRRLQRYQRNQHVIMGSRGTVDIVEHVAAVDEKLTNVRLALEDLTLLARDHDVRIDSSLSGVGIVRFDAYYDLGGRQSTAVAFLNHLGDGVVITTVVSRDFARMYVKLLKGGESDIPLAPEEIEAIEQARGSGPFTIRPRPEGAQAAGVTGETESPSPGAPMSTGLPGLRADTERELDRENRRRRRKGLPLVEEQVVPSARGWDEPQTPAAGSLADRFVKERRQSLRHAGGTDTEDDRLAPVRDKDGDGREL
ncbi:MAG: DUF4446 family protein [Actinomycetia bacterium]|nr:DUF4446 family protein [Actinomycetes bacterium]